MATPTLIYCGGGNERFMEIAVNNGYKYGARLPSTTYGDLYFADQNWKNPDRDTYIRELARLLPRVATVLDWERMEQLGEILGWAEEAAQYVDTVVIIPKVHGGINKLPRMIGRASVRLGYSVPTKHGGTDVFLSEFTGWPVHLLGGSPGSQMRLAQYLDVYSADGNMAMKLASTRCLYWKPGRTYGSNAWEPLGEKYKSFDAHYRAFEISCNNIIKAWRKL